MDSLFDDDQDNVGSEIEAYCPSPRCKTDTNHTVISMYEDEIRRVQCQVCGDVHAYRKPRGDAAEAQARRAAAERARSGEPEAVLGRGDGAGHRAGPGQLPALLDPRHLRGNGRGRRTRSSAIGFVTELLPDNKVEITFKDERRVLVHNRSDLAQKMPELAEMPAPRDLKKKRKRESERSRHADDDTTRTTSCAAASARPRRSGMLADRLRRGPAGARWCRRSPGEEERNRKKAEREADRGAQGRRTRGTRSCARSPSASRSAPSARRSKIRLKEEREADKAKRDRRPQGGRSTGRPRIARRPSRRPRPTARRSASPRERDRRPSRRPRHREKKRVAAERDKAKKKADADKEAREEVEAGQEAQRRQKARPGQEGRPSRQEASAAERGSRPRRRPTPPGSASPPSATRPRRRPTPTRSASPPSAPRLKKKIDAEKKRVAAKRGAQGAGAKQADSARRSSARRPPTSPRRRLASRRRRQEERRP